MAELSSFEIGQTVELADGQVGTVQFVGNTHFASGGWIGVAFDEATGKNDGSVQGKRYFECATAHGMFVRPAVATILDHPTPKPAGRMNGKAREAGTKEKPYTAAKRHSVMDAGSSKRQSINAGSPTPVAGGASRLTGLSRSPKKLVRSAAASTSSSPRVVTPSTSSRKSLVPSAGDKRTSMAPPPTPSSSKKVARPSLAGTMNGSARPPKNSSTGPLHSSTHRLSAQSEIRDPIDSVSGASQNSVQSISESESEALAVRDVPPDLISQNDDPSDALLSSLSRASSHNIADAVVGKRSPSRGRSPAHSNQRSNPAEAAMKRELDDVYIKLRIMERKRAEDREKVKKSEKVQEERDRFEGIIQKLQNKYQPQQQELVILKQQVKDAEAKVENLEAQKAEQESVHEMATLDREMAEEMAESARLELQTLRQKYDDFEMEVEVLREENQELSKEISPEDKTSQGWLQLERSNDRYREALIRLRDISQEQEMDLKAQITSLEQDLLRSGKVQAENETYGERLLQSESLIEDLKQQLETASSAEDIIEGLTETNLTLNRKLEELNTTIEELESLQELNNELEINHTENEKQLLNDLDYQDTCLADERKKQVVLDGKIQDLEYTVSRFRDLVSGMQSDLEDMRASQEITELQANELNTRSRAMQDLNLKLQTAASRTQAKAVDIQLGKLEAQEASEHLAIVQLFLPESFQSERDSIQSLLRFKRVSFKAGLLHEFSKEKINERISSPVLVQEDGVFALCDVLDKFTWISSTCNRFVNAISTCDPDTFRRLGTVSYEMDPVERGLDTWIDALRRDEFRSELCVNQLPRYIALMKHLAEVHISESLEHFADGILARTVMMQSHTDTAALTLSCIRSIANLKLTKIEADARTADEEGVQVMMRLDTLITQARSAKMMSIKTTRQVEDLQSRQLTLDTSTLSIIEQSEHSTATLASVSRQLGLSMLKPNAEVLHEPGGLDSQPLDTQEWSELLQPVSSNMQIVMNHLHSIHSLTTGLSQVTEFTRPISSPPWATLAESVHAAALELSARQTETMHLKQEVTEKSTALALKERLAEEMGVKLEVLERRMGESSGKREKVKELEAAVDAALSREKMHISQIDQIRVELQEAIGDCNKWRRLSEVHAQSGQKDLDGSDSLHTSAASMREMDAMRSAIKAQQGAIRYLRNSKHAREVTSYQQYLSEPISPASFVTPAIATEANDVLREMLNLVKHSDHQSIKLQHKLKDGRGRWQPVRDTTSWQIQSRKEEWAEWNEWRDDVGRKARRVREQYQRRVTRSTQLSSEGRIPAPPQTQYPNKATGGAGVRVKEY